MIKIYHNPRCSKSRAGLDVLEASGKEFQVVKYMQEKLSEEELAKIISLLGIKPIDLVRKNEPIWKEKYKNRKLSGKPLIKVLSRHPQLIERPIVVNGEQAVIGRPAEAIHAII